MQVLDRHGMRATVALNSDLCAYHPEIIEAGRKRGWEWMGHLREQYAPPQRSAAGRGKAIHSPRVLLSQWPIHSSRAFGLLR